MFRGFDVGLLGFNGALGFADALVLEFNFERLIFDFFHQHVVLAVVLHVVQLVVVLVDGLLRRVDFVLLGLDVGFEVFDVLGVFAHAVRHAFDFVFEVLHFEGEFATEDFDAVDFRQHGLQLVEFLQALLYGQVYCFFFRCCHYGKLLVNVVVSVIFPRDIFFAHESHEFTRIFFKELNSDLYGRTNFH